MDVTTNKGTEFTLYMVILGLELGNYDCVKIEDIYIEIDPAMVLYGIEMCEQHSCRSLCLNYL
jgi:hypothetical protein